MGKIIPYLLVPNGKEAINLYNKIFSAKELSRMPYNEEAGQSMNLPEDFDYANSTMHAAISIGDNPIYLADNYGDQPKKSTVDVLLEVDSHDEIEKYYNNAKKHGCKIVMDLEKTFWGAWFTRFVDPFGVGWQMNFQEEEMTQ